jgi:3'-5' exonuclease
MKSSVIVWDLETVPDLGGFAAANDLLGKSDVEIREAMGDKFPKHIYHSIVCIGALIAHWEPDHWAVDAVGAPGRGEVRFILLGPSSCRNAPAKFWGLGRGFAMQS